MKKTITFLFVCAAMFNSFAQAPSTAWAKNFGSTNIAYSDQGRSVTTDAAGNTYHTGIFNDTGIFDSYSLTASGYDNMFIAKRDANGNVMWVAKSSKSTYVLDIAVDASGNVYTTGYFSQSSSAPNSFGSIVMANEGYEDGFIAKCDPNGNFLWAHNFGGDNFDAGNALTVDASGNVYVTGQFNSDLAIGTLTFSSGWGNRDAFLAKYDASGNVVWAKTYGGTGIEEALEICADASGNVYTVGTFSNTAAFGTYSLTSTATSGKRNVYVLKTDGSGNEVWASKLDVNSSDYYYDGFDYGIAADGSGNAYVTGCFKGVANFGTYSVTTNSGNSGDHDVFLTKLDASGNVSWVKQYGWNFNDRGTSISCDATGNIYSTGIFESNVSFGSENFTGGGVYIMKHTPAGNITWAKQIGESGYYYTSDVAIAVNTNNEVLLTGNFRYRIKLDNDTVYSSGGNDKDGFIMKINAGSSAISVKENEFEKHIVLMPNPAISQTTLVITTTKAEKPLITVMDVYGKIISETMHNELEVELNIENYSPGIYYLQVSDNKGNKAIKKLVKL